jgi:alpha-L-fucosidase
MSKPLLSPANQSVEIVPFGAVPSPRQVLWQRIEIYALVHFSLSTFGNKEWGDGSESAASFDPSALDPRQWARICRESGMKGLILVCKHHDGFCLWPTQTTEHCVRNSPWKNGQGDVVAETAAACREFGLKFGVYLSPWDRNHAEYGCPGYVAVYHRQLRELLTGYGPLFEVWFDGANGGDGYYGGTRERRSIEPETYYQWDKIEAMVREFQPDACTMGFRDIRYVGNEGGVADETCWATQSFHGHPTSQKSEFPSERGNRHGAWMPAECDFPLRKGWFYHPGDFIRPPKTLLDIYFTSVGRGGTMNIGLAPDTRGLIHEDDVRSLQGWKTMMDEIFSHDLLQAPGVRVSASQTRAGNARFQPGHVLDGNPETYWACDDNAPTPELIFEFEKPVKFNVLSLREYTPLGQRVDAFVAEIWQDDKWIEVGAATSIGHRRVLILKNAEARKFRLRFTQVSACPAISEVSLYRAGLHLILDGKLSIVRNVAGLVELRSTNSGLSLRYTTDGTEPDETSPSYAGAFSFPGSGTIKAYGYIANEKGARIPTVSATFGVDRSDWSIVRVSLDSPFDNAGCAGVAKLLDDNPETYWHTYHKDKSLSRPPHEVVFDMKRTIKVSGFTFQPRSSLLTKGLEEALPDQYEFHLSADGVNWQLAIAGEFANIKAAPGMQLISLAETQSGRFLKFVVPHVIDDGNYLAVAGVGVIESA